MKGGLKQLTDLKKKKKKAALDPVVDYFPITPPSVSLLMSCLVRSPTLCKEKVRTQKVASSMVSSRVTWVIPYVSVPRLGQYWSHLIWICKHDENVNKNNKKVTVQSPVSLPSIPSTWTHLHGWNIQLNLVYSKKEKTTTRYMDARLRFDISNSSRPHIEAEKTQTWSGTWWMSWMTSIWVNQSLTQCLCILTSNHLQSHMILKWNLQDRAGHTL